MGKISFGEVFLYVVKFVNWLGSADGEMSNFDFDLEEILCKISYVFGVGVFEWKKYKINLMDIFGSLVFVVDIWFCM